MNPDWEGFGRAILKGWPEPACESMDGGEAQELGVRFGVLVGEERNEPCGEGCVCSEYYDDDRPWTCYRVWAGRDAESVEVVGEVEASAERENARESAQEPRGGDFGEKASRGSGGENVA